MFLSADFRFLYGAALAMALASPPAFADSIRHPTAIFAGLDKTTGRIINFDVAIDETVQFGALQVTPRVCNTRPQTEAPQTTSFVEVDEQIGKLDQKQGKSEGKAEARRIFSGWMFAASPGLHGVEHPVYDVWLVDCKGGKDVATAPPPPPAAEQTPAVAPDTKKSKKSRKVEPATPAPVEAQSIGPDESPVAEAPPPEETAPVDEAAKKPKKKKKRKKDAAQPAPESPAFPF
jgi:hypothetical protein